MKKIKWILLAITLALAALFLFATCKKTKALENKEYPTYILSTYDTNNSVFFMGDLPKLTNGQNELLAIINIGYSSNLFDIYINGTSTGYRLSLNHSSASNRYVLDVPINAVGFFWCWTAYDDDVLQDVNFAFSFGYYYLDNTYSYLDTYNTYYYFNNLASQYIDDLRQQWQGTTGINYRILPGTSKFTALHNIFTFDNLDYSPDAPTETITDNITESLAYINDTIYLRLYNMGYQLGYQEGYDDGETYGYNQGYNDGVNDNAAGQQQAYDRGYDDGIRDGYLPAYNSGYSRGYQEGYDEGLAGATPVSQTVTLLGSIFGAIGTVLSIQLFPGFTLGLLILVPLFFGVLGLILWIWRRN